MRYRWACQAFSITKRPAEFIALSELRASSCLSMVYAAMAMAAWGRPVNVTTASLIGMGVLVMVVGNFLGKIRPNWVVGVITPWTLASRESWNKTHRLSGWLSIVMGLLIAATGIIWTTWMLALLILACLASVITVIAYSYIVYRDDPHPVPPAWPFPGANRGDKQDDFDETSKRRLEGFSRFC